MGDLSKGVTWVDGDEVDAAGLNSHVDDATLKTNAITDRTAAGSLASADKLLLYQASSAALRSVTYAILASNVLSAAATTANRKDVAQTAHGFSVGDVIYRDKWTSTYLKAKATYLQQTFATTDVDTTNSRIALSAGTVTKLTNGDRVFLTSGTTLPAPLVTSKFYYVSKFDSTHIELYSETGLVTKLTITDVGTGTHTLHYDLPKWETVGVVSVVTDANNFTVTYVGEVSTLTGLTDGLVYFLSPTTAGAVTATPPTSEGQLVVPVYVATSATSAVVWGGGPQTLSPYSIRNDHISDQAINRRALDSTTRQSLDRNIGADRQMVLSGAVDSSGYANYLSPGTGLSVALAAATTPLIVSFANGFDDTLGYNFVEKVSSNQTFSSLPASTEAVFLYVDRDSNGTLTYGYTKQPPEYGFAKTVYRDRGCVPKLDGTVSAGNNANYIITASSIAGGTAFPSKAFDRTVNAGWQATGTTGNIVCQFQTARVINAMSMGMWFNTTSGPASFTIEGSNNGSSWTTLGSAFTGVTWTTGVTQTFTVANTTAYSYYRMNCTANGGGAALIVYEMNWHEAIDHYYVIPEAAMYSYSGGVWTKVNRVFLGECKTSAASVSSGNIYTYAIRGRYVTPVFNTASLTEYTKRHNIGTDQVTAWTKARLSPSYPWPSDALLDSNAASGVSITLGQADMDVRADRTLATLNTSTVTTYGASALKPGKYVDGGESPGTQYTTGQAQFFATRSF
jgi:hypothetical protein